MLDQIVVPSALQQHPAVGIDEIWILMTSSYGRLMMIKSSEVPGIKATPFFCCTRINMILQHHALHRSSAL